MERGAADEEALEAWDGVLFDRFVKFKEIVTEGLGAHGEAALAAHPPRAGDRVLDIDPVAAIRNVCQALVPDGRLCLVVWRRKLDNDWLHRAERSSSSIEEVELRR